MLLKKQKESANTKDKYNFPSVSYINPKCSF